MRRIADLLLFAAVVAFGAVVRFGGIAIPSLWLDEILDYDVATKLVQEPLWRWLTGFASEHGPLFFASELAGRFVSSPELAARFAPAVFGVAAIAVAWFAAREGLRESEAGAAHSKTVPGDAGPKEQRTPVTLGPAVSLTFAILLAGSPLAIYYSREARPYGLLLLLSTVMLALLLRSAGTPRGLVVAGAESRFGGGSMLRIILPLLALFATSGAAPLLVSVALTSVVAFVIERRRVFAWFAATNTFAALLVPLLYRRLPGGAAIGAGFRPVTSRFFLRLLQSFSIASVDPITFRSVAYGVAVLALIGAITLLDRDRLRGAIVIGMTLLPVAVSLIALWRLRHWYAVRYLLTALPGYLLLVAIGITATLRFLLRGRTAVAVPALALLAAALVVREGWPAARNDPYRKLNWRVIAATIHEHAHPRDAVVTTNDWSYVCLDFYLRRLPPRVRLISAGESSSRAASVVAHNSPVWIVSAGFHREGDIGDWSCQFPVVLASPLESFRLHYAPGLQHLLLNRMTAADARALTARYPKHVMHLGAESDFFLGGGWYGSEGPGGDISRWTGPEPVTVMLIASASIDHRLLLRMAPFDFRGAPPQTATVALNGAPLAQVTLAHDWKDYVFNVPSTHWRDGVNLVTVAFSRANVPASLDPSSRDFRALAGRFNRIAVLPAGGELGTDSSPELTRMIRINEPAGELLDENAWWRGAKRTGISITEANRSALLLLLGRLGFDPQAVIPRLEQKKVRFEDLAETLAYDSACLNDSDFLRVVYPVLVSRSIDASGERYFSEALKKKETREGVVRALAESEELKRALH